MLKSLHIHDYRRFGSFELNNLGRINLLVGTNNCGKSSILEAIHLLRTGGDLEVVKSILVRRGECILADFASGNQGASGFQGVQGFQSARDALHVDVAHLFHGHSLQRGDSIDLLANEDTESLSIRCVSRADMDKALKAPANPIKNNGHEPLYLQVNARFGGIAGIRNAYEEELVSGRGLPFYEGDRRFRSSRERELTPPVQFVSTESLTIQSAGRLWSTIALTANEERVVSALQVIDDSIERIAFVQTDPRWNSAPVTRGGFVLKQRGIPTPTSIGSMGDGAWRVAALAIAAVATPNGILLVDEIDTGLHYTVMDGLWKTLLTLSRELDIQIFATTHSRDCVERLAAICHSKVVTDSEVTIQRIDPALSEAITFTESDIVLAAERGWEVR